MITFVPRKTFIILGVIIEALRGENLQAPGLCFGQVGILLLLTVKMVGIKKTGTPSILSAWYLFT